MNPEAAKRLGQQGVDEYWRLQQRLIKQVGEHSLADGLDFQNRCTVEFAEGLYAIWCDGVPLVGVQSSRRDVIRELFNGACLQLGR